METTACVELNPSGNFSQLSNGTTPFNYLHIKMYPSVTLSLLPDILGQPYSYFIIDFGTFHPNIAQAFFRCDLKIMIGNICPWKWKHYFEIINQLKINHRNCYNDIHYLGTPGLKENQKIMKSRFPVSIMPVPFIDNPFHITSKNFGFFENLLEVH